MERDRLTGLQIARAFAALSIAYFHSWKVMMGFPPDTAYPIVLLKSYGWVAVDFFFAISGFVICMVATKPNFDPLSFMIRRAFRLYPLWIATSFIFLYLTRYLGRSALQTDAYFGYSLTLLPTEGFPFYDLGWSLQHELAFYLLASILVPAGGLAALIGALAVGVVADHLFALPWYFHQFFSYYPNFMAGIFAFIIWRRGVKVGVLMPVIASIVVFVWIAPLATVQRNLYPVALFFALLAFLNLKSREDSVFERAGKLLGDASYSIYLIHPLVFSYIYIMLQPPLPPIWTEEFLRFGALIATCAFAIASWMWFERPMIYIGNVLAGRLRAKPIGDQSTVSKGSVP
jgi:exopolysaccharide production protein ExoZ